MAEAFFLEKVNSQGIVYDALFFLCLFARRNIQTIEHNDESYGFEYDITMSDTLIT